jgi:hypothetical protein
MSFVLNNLRGELVKMGYVPVKAICTALNCTEKTARNKLSGATSFSVSEAVTVVERYFNPGTDIASLFAEYKDSA